MSQRLNVVPGPDRGPKLIEQPRCPWGELLPIHPAHLRLS